MSSESGFVLFMVVAMIVGCYLKLEKYFRDEKNEHELLTNNPEAYVAKKAAEEDAKDRKMRRAGSALQGGIGIARFFLKR